jgi:hypothetical protein
MRNTLGPLMERNLLEVFGRRVSAPRTTAIAELFTADLHVFRRGEEVNGREAIDAKVGSILEDGSDFMFRAVGPAQINNDLARSPWEFDPPGAPPVVMGTDIAVFEHGRILDAHAIA